VYSCSGSHVYSCSGSHVYSCSGSHVYSCSGSHAPLTSGCSPLRHLPASPAGPLLVPHGVYNVFGTCQVVNDTTPMYCPPGTDTTQPESQVYVERADGGSGLIKPGETLFWKSVATGKYCRNVDNPPSIACDLDVPTLESVITYTGGLGACGRSGMRGPSQRPQRATAAMLLPHLTTEAPNLQLGMRCWCGGVACNLSEAIHIG
jgi:hypothetical protein